MKCRWTNHGAKSRCRRESASLFSCGDAVSVNFFGGVVVFRALYVPLLMLQPDSPKAYAFAGARIL